MPPAPPHRSHRLAGARTQTSTRCPRTRPRASREHPRPTDDPRPTILSVRRSSLQRRHHLPIPRSPRARHLPTASASPAILRRERDHGPQPLLLPPLWERSVGGGGGGLVSRADHGDAHPSGARRVAAPHRFLLLLVRPRYR